jgi:hypothetical protein
MVESLEENEDTSKFKFLSNNAAAFGPQWEPKNSVTSGWAPY